jgi:hypothetical protein
MILGHDFNHQSSIINSQLKRPARKPLPDKDLPWIFTDLYPREYLTPSVLRDSACSALSCQ